MYQMMIADIILVATIVFLVVMASLIIFHSKQLASYYFVLFIVSVIIWVFTNLLANLVIPFGEPSYLFWTRATLIGPAMMPVFLLIFADLFQQKALTLNKYILAGFITVSSILLILVPTTYNVESVKIIDPDNYITTFTPGLAYTLLAIHLLLGVAVSTYLLIVKLLKAKLSQRSQIRAIIYGIMVTIVIGVITNIILPIFGNSFFINFSPVSAVFVVIFTTYAIVAYRMFDIRVIIKRTVVYSVLLAFVLITYALIVFIFSQILGGSATFGISSFAPNIIAAIMIAFGFDPLRRWLQNVTDRYLFKGEYDPQDIANDLAKSLSNAVNLDESLDSMMAVVTKQMRIGRVATLVIRTVDKDRVVKRMRSTGFSNVSDLEQYPTGALIEYFAKNPRMLVIEEAGDEDSTSNHQTSMLPKVLAQLEHFHAAVAMGLQIKGTLIGVLMIGEKLSGDSFSRDDLDTLELIGSQTALSIEKAQFYEEDKLKSEFISIASHELLTPTAAIEGYLSMALDKKMPQTGEQRNQYIQRAYDSSRRLADLVKDLLSISRIESGRMKIVPAPLDIIAIIDQAVGELQVTAQEKSLTLTFEKPSTKISKVIGDPDRMMQVCINLINNSIKYTPKGSITVKVQQLKDTVAVAVNDTGIGIAPDDQKHLFEKFHRIDNPATAGIMGTGLGLYIVKNIITLLGGTIAVESAAGKGSTFTFALPIAKES